MEPSKQVITLDQSHRLKELGVVAPSMFYHTQFNTPSNPNIHEYGLPQNQMKWHIFYGRKSDITGADIFEEFAAYSVAELGAMLPEKIISKGREYFLQMDKYKGWQASYTKALAQQNLIISEHVLYMAECLADLLIKLLETNLLTAHDCNKSIQ